MNVLTASRFLVRGVVVAGLLLTETHGLRAQVAFVVPSKQRQLFLDDVGIAEIDNLTRTMHQPAKKGAVIRPDYHSGVSSYQTRSAPMWDPQASIYRFWLNGRPDDMESGACSYFESRDGLHWEKPNLGQVEYHGVRENNLVSLTVQGKVVGLECAVYDPTDPDPTRRFKGICRRPGTIQFLYPIASDGVTWRHVSAKFPIRKGDEDNFNFDPVEHLFIATLRHNGGPFGRAVDLATSKDFENWTHHGLIFHADEQDQELGRKHMEARLADTTLYRPYAINPAKCTVDVYNMGVSRYEGLYIGFPAMFHHTGSHGFHLVQLVCSRDLKNWNRLGDRKTFIGPSRKGGGAYDLTQIIGPSRAVVRGDELWFYYTGLKYRGGFELKDGKWVPVEGFDPDPDRSAVCLAVLRRDGFISLDAGEQPGMIQTVPFKLPGGKLFVNVDAVEGEIFAEVLNAEGQVVARSSPLTGDLLHEPMQWTEGGMADLKGLTASVRFTFCNGQFYSYWLE